MSKEYRAELEKQKEEARLAYEKKQDDCDSEKLSNIELPIPSISIELEETKND